MHLHKPTLSSKNSSHQAHCADTLTMRAQPAANTVYSFSAAMPVNTQLLECVWCVGVYCDWESRLKSTQRASLSLFGDTHKRTLRQRHLSCHLLLWSTWAMAAESLNTDTNNLRLLSHPKIAQHRCEPKVRGCWTRTHGIYTHVRASVAITYDE